MFTRIQRYIMDIFFFSLLSSFSFTFFLSCKLYIAIGELYISSQSLFRTHLLFLLYAVDMLRSHSGILVTFIIAVLNFGVRQLLFSHKIYHLFFPLNVVCEGEILAKQLARLGAKLILSARNEAELERVKRQLTGMSFH